MKLEKYLSLRAGFAVIAPDTFAKFFSSSMIVITFYFLC